MGQNLLRMLGQGLQAGGTLGKGLSAQKQAEANAQIDRQDAARLMEESRRRANIIREQGRAAAGREKVRAAGAGFTQEGTSLQLQIDEIQAAEFNALEELRVGSAGEKRALDSAALNVQRGKVARRSSIFDAAATGLGFLGQAEKRKSTTSLRKTGQANTTSLRKSSQSALSKASALDRKNIQSQFN